MQLNLRKIDERIQKLQEIRRIASDPEMVAMILEFLAVDESRTESARTELAAPESMLESVPAAKSNGAAAPRPDEAELVNQVVKGMDGQGSGLWSRKRA